MTSTLTPDLQGISSIQLNLLQGMSSILKEKHSLKLSQEYASHSGIVDVNEIRNLEDRF